MSATSVVIENESLASIRTGFCQANYRCVAVSRVAGHPPTKEIGRDRGEGRFWCSDHGSGTIAFRSDRRMGAAENRKSSEYALSFSEWLFTLLYLLLLSARNR